MWSFWCFAVIICCALDLWVAGFLTFGHYLFVDLFKDFFFLPFLTFSTIIYVLYMYYTKHMGSFWDSRWTSSLKHCFFSFLFYSSWFFIVLVWIFSSFLIFYIQFSFKFPHLFFLKHVVNYCQCTFLVKTIFFKQAHAFLHLNAIKYSFTKHLYNFFLILSFISEFVSIHWFFSSLWVISSFFGPCLLILIWCQTLFFFLLESSRYTLIPINAIFFLSYLTSRINPVPDTQSAPEAEFQSRSPLNFSKCP